MYYCIIVLLYYCITELLYYCITVLVYNCITVLVCITVLLHYRINNSLADYSLESNLLPRAKPIQRQERD